MNQTKALINSLKRELKIQGITYAQVGKHLNLSENSIKRLFSQQKFSVHRLEKVCQLIGLDLSDLVQKMLDIHPSVEMLTEEQENEIASDIKLLLVAICSLHQWTLSEIIDTYSITEAECIQLLAKLDRLKIIELMPLNRIKLTVAKTFRWRPGGPVQKFFEQKVQPDFFKSSFNGSGEKLVFNTGMLSRSSIVEIATRIDRLAADFNDLHQQDTNLALQDRFGSGIVIAIRPWEFKLFQQLRKSPSEKIFQSIE